MQQSRRRRQGETVWRGIVARFEKSGLPVRTFCQRENIGEWCFYRWRSRFKASVNVSRAVSAAPFLDLGSLGSATRRIEMRLELGDGLVL